MSKPRPRKRDESAKRKKPSGRAPSAQNWIWGQHAVAAALGNPKRRLKRLFATKNAAERAKLGGTPSVTVSPTELSSMSPQGAIHQGIAAEFEPLQPVQLDDLIGSGAKRLVVLDQISDPHNLGAIFRSAAAFGFSGLILQDRNTPPITGIVAKSAAGAIETVSECRIVNVARALDRLGVEGFHTVGLSGDGARMIADTVSGATKIAVVMGAEGSGLRPGVAKACAEVAKIPMAPGMESLNVSNAAAIAFYEVFKLSL